MCSQQSSAIVRRYHGNMNSSQDKSRVQPSIKKSVPISHVHTSLRSESYFLIQSHPRYVWQQVLNKILSSYKCQYKPQLFLQRNLITQHITGSHLSYYQRETTFHHINGTLQSGLVGEASLSAAYLIRRWVFKFSVNWLWFKYLVSCAYMHESARYDWGQEKK